MDGNVSDVHVQEEYRLLSLQTTPRPRTEAEYNHAHASATLPFNKAKNRYTDVLPVESTRIKLAPVEDDPGSDYINANQVTDPTPAAHDGSTNDSYICSQAPLQNTLNDFWRMVWEQVRLQRHKGPEEIWRQRNPKFRHLCVCFKYENSDPPFVFFIDFLTPLFSIWLLSTPSLRRMFAS